MPTESRTRFPGGAKGALQVVPHALAELGRIGPIAGAADDVEDVGVMVEQRFEVVIDCLLVHGTVI